MRYIRRGEGQRCRLVQSDFGLKTNLNPQFNLRFKFLVLSQCKPISYAGNFFSLVYIQTLLLLTFGRNTADEQGTFNDIFENQP